MARRRAPHRPLSVGSSHWRADGGPKVRFDSRHEALGAAEERSRESGLILAVYRCAYCDGWHMGKPDGRDGE